MQIDPVRFTSFELAGWQRAAQPYDESWGNLTRQAGAPILAALDLAPGDALLDVATGPGYVAGLAASRGAKAVGVDFSPAMVDKAQAAFPEATFQEGDAQNLPFDDDTFDVACMNFGILHLADPERGVQELVRVVRSGGRVAFTSWSSPERVRGDAAILDALQAHGTPAADIPAGPDYFRFSDPEVCAATLMSGGAIVRKITVLNLVWRRRDVATFFAAYLDGSVRMAGLLRSQTPEALRAIEASLAVSLAPFWVNGELRIPMPALLTSGVKAAK